MDPRDWKQSFEPFIVETLVSAKYTPHGLSLWRNQQVKISTKEGECTLGK